MFELLMKTYVVLLPVVLGYIVRMLQKQQKIRNANSRANMLLLRIQLIEYHDKYSTIGEIPSYVYQNFCEMYDTYRELGGNGMIVKMYEEIHDLHFKQKKEG